MKKKYFSPTINVYNIVEAETILAGSKHELTFITDVTPFVPTPEEELDGETHTASGTSTSVQP